MDANIRQKFFMNTDHTGRFCVTSYRTGKTYYVEPIGSSHGPEWGSYNPSTGNIEHKKGAGKFRGSIDAKDSLITEENGFKNIELLSPGMSPLYAIELRDERYPTLER